MVVYTQQFYGSRVVIPTQQVAPERILQQSG